MGYFDDWLQKRWIVLRLNIPARSYSFRGSADAAYEAAGRMILPSIRVMLKINHLLSGSPGRR